MRLCAWANFVLRWKGRGAAGGDPPPLGLRPRAALRWQVAPWLPSLCGPNGPTAPRSSRGTTVTSDLFLTEHEVQVPQPFTHGPCPCEPSKGRANRSGTGGSRLGDRHVNGTQGPLLLCLRVPCPCRLRRLTSNLQCLVLPFQIRAFGCVCWLVHQWSLIIVPKHARAASPTAYRPNVGYSAARRPAPAFCLPPAATPCLSDFSILPLGRPKRPLPCSNAQMGVHRVHQQPQNCAH